MTNTPNTSDLSRCEDGELRKTARLLAEAIVESIETGEQVAPHENGSCEAASEIPLGGSPTPKRPSEKPRKHASAEQEEGPAQAESEPLQRLRRQALDDGSGSAPTQN